MANKYINLYSNATAGGTDGTYISEDTTAPLAVQLDASANESKVLPVALRCETGYQTTGDVKITFSGTTAAKWSVSNMEDGSYYDSLTISDSIGATNKVFYIKASASEDEDPVNDTSVSINVSATIQAV